MGIIKHEFKVSQLTLVTNSNKPETYLNQRIMLLHAVMPPGTKLLRVTSQASLYSLSHDYTIEMDHPVFTDGQYVEVNMTRNVYRDSQDPNLIKEISVFTGLSYFLADGSVDRTYHP